jgi:hypothetical protein
LIISNVIKESVSDAQARSFLKIKYPNLFLFFLLTALLPYLLLSFYIHPIADDFIYALKGEDFLSNLWRDYLTWNGRYTSNIIVFFNTTLIKYNFLYKIYPIVLIALLIISAYWFLNMVLPKAIKQREKLILALIFILLFFNLIPRQSEALYWFTGSATYVLPCTFFLVYIGLVISYFKNKFFLSKYFHLSLSTLLLFLLCGFNEVLTILLLLFHLVAAILFKPKTSKAFFILLIVVIAGILLMATAPGNSIRSINFPYRHRLLHSVVYSCLQTIRFSSIWILSPAFLLATFIYIYIAKQISFSILLNPVVLLLALFSMIFYAAFAPYWSTGILGQHRTINNACFLFLLSWFFTLHHFIRFIPQSFLEIIQTKFFRSTVIALLVITFFITRNSLTSWTDLISGNARQYDVELSQREALLRQSRQQQEMDCKVPALTVFPSSIFVLDIQPQSSSWINIDYARYYGLNSVSIQQ